MSALLDYRSDYVSALLDIGAVGSRLSSVWLNKTEVRVIRHVYGVAKDDLSGVHPSHCQPNRPKSEYPIRAQRRRSPELSLRTIAGEGNLSYC